MRTSDEYQKLYAWLSARQFAERAQVLTEDGEPSTELVRKMIRSGDVESLRPPYVMDISRSGRPRYRIDPQAVDLYRRESFRRVEELQGAAES